MYFNDTNRMVLFSFNNIDTWPSYGQKCRACPYLGIRFWPSLSHLWANWTEFFMGVQEIVIYRLMMKNLSNDVYILVLIFRATFGGNMGIATTRALNGLGPPSPTTKLARWMTILGQPLSRNHVFEIFRGEPPLKNIIIRLV